MLADADCKNASCPPDRKQKRFYDTGGLYLQVSPAGSKRWFLKYRVQGKEKQLALGSYPAISLKAARIARDAAKAEKAAGVDPVLARQQEKMRQSLTADNSFKSVALEWYEKQKPHWSASHATRTLSWLERDLFPFFGNRAMDSIAAPDLLAALHRIEQRGAVETAHRVLQVAGQIWTYWLPTAPAMQRNIAEGLQARLQPYRGKVFPAITEPAHFGELLRAMRQYKGGIVVKTALLLAPLLYQRPGNLRMMEWRELDLRRGLWTIPSAKMKRTVKEKEQGEDHVVPLPRQAIALLQDIQPLTGHRQYVFTNERSYDRPISDNSVRTALYSLGFGKEQSWHGFRARARVNRVGEGKKHDLIIDYNGILKNVCKGLESEEQLAIFDLLQKDSLTKGERDAIKKVAKELLDKLTSDKLQIDHWREKATAQAQVKAEIIKHLFAHLPSGAYDAGEINLKFVRIYTAGFSNDPRACH